MIWAVGNQLPVIKYQHPVAVSFYFIQIRRRKKEGCILTTSPQQMAPNLLTSLMVQSSGWMLQQKQPGLGWDEGQQ
jgi:hypothetical protein